MANNASFSFDPITINVKAGDKFPVDILIFSGSEKVISSDIFIDYDSEKLTALPHETETLQSGGLFQKTDAKIISPGKLYLFGLNENISISNPANGKIATVYFQAKSSGTTELNFNCISFQEQTSKIIKNDQELSNIVDCQASRSHNLVIKIEPSSDILGASASNLPGANYYLITAILLAGLVGILLLRYKKLKH